jgi:leucyl aminopeptidase
MKIILSGTDARTYAGEALVVGIFESGDPESGLVQALDRATAGLITDAMSEDGFSGKESTSVVLHRPHGVQIRRLVLAGLGPRERAGVESARRLGGIAARRLTGEGIRHVAVAVPDDLDGAAEIQAAVEGFLTGAGRIDAYRTGKGKKRGGDPYHGPHNRLTLLCPGRITAAMRSAAAAGESIAEGVILARRLVNTPGNLMTPTVLAREATKACRAAGVSVTVYNEKQLREQGFGGVMAVSQGSAQSPRFIVMRYRPAGTRAASRAPLALVGKGITFDSGGISIKPSKGMEDMKADMAGAAAVIGAMAAIGHLKPSRPVIGIVPACENMPSGKATRPGDVIKTLSGKTIEILNTDAEGRLILADALTYAVRQKPDAIVDIATLTGACVVALGHVYAGLMGNDEEWLDQVRRCAADHGEKVWPLPMDSEYDDLVKSAIADVRNTGKDQPGAITAAKLLEQFVGDCRWAHLDIAGVEWRNESAAWVGAGPTGFGVRTFVALARR